MSTELHASLWNRIEKRVKRAFLGPATWLRYGTTRPRRAKLHGCAHWIFIDPADPCALKKVVHEPLRGKVSPNLVFWRAFLAHLQPRLVVDVGVNYGECLFGADYPPEARVHGFEANPRLLPFLEQSRRAHPAADRITLHHCLVSDQPAEAVPFYVNPDWSGSSSALPEINRRPDNLVLDVPARRIDVCIPAADAAGARVLFKMDIEGYESKALAGFEGTLTAAAMAAGLIEFDLDYLRWAGEDPAAYLSGLRDRFDTFRLADAKRGRLVPVASLDDIPFLHGTTRKHTDLVLVTRTTPGLDWLPPGWSAAP